MDTLTALKEHGPWLAMSELVKLTGKDAPTLREELKEKLAAGKVKKIGKKRGTRYGLPESKAPESNDNLDFKVEIVKIMEKKKDRVSRKVLCEEIGTYDAKIRPSLLALVEEGVVLDNGKKKGQLFWLAKHDDAGLIEPEPEPEPKEPAKREAVSQSDKPPVRDVEELVRIGLSNLALGEILTVDELKSHISSSANHNFPHSEIFKTLHQMIKDGRVPRLKRERRNVNGSGWRTFYWMELN